MTMSKQAGEIVALVATAAATGIAVAMAIEATPGRGKFGRSSHTLPEENPRSYGNKRDYPKIELFYDGDYKSTTTWARTLKEAKQHFIKAHPNLEPSLVKAHKASR